MPVLQRAGDLDGLVADLVGRADAVAGLHAAAGHHAHHRVGVVVAAGRLTPAADAVVGAPAELPAPDHQRVVQQPPLPQVPQQPRVGLVDRADAGRVRTPQVVVRVPPGRVHLHEPHAGLHQFAGQQALAAEVVGVRLADAIQLQRVLGLPADVEGGRDLRLHAVGQLVGRRAGGQLVLVRVPVRVQRVELSEQVEVPPLHAPRDAGRRVEVQDRRALRAERRALKVCRQVGVGPVGGPALRERRFGQHDEGREVLVLAAEPVGDPRAHGRLPAEAAAGVDVVAGGGVVDGLRLQAVVDAELVRHLRQVDPLVGHGDAGLAVPLEAVRRLHEVAFSGRHGGGELVLPLEDLHVPVREGRLGVERVDVAGAALHEQLNDGLGLRGVVGVLGRGRTGRGVPLQERGQRKRSETETGVAKQTAAGECVHRRSHVHRLAANASERSRMLSRRRKRSLAFAAKRGLTARRQIRCC